MNISAANGFVASSFLLLLSFFGRFAGFFLAGMESLLGRPPCTGVVS
jgi:hypothetical protein